MQMSLLSYKVLLLNRRKQEVIKLLWNLSNQVKMLLGYMHAKTNSNILCTMSINTIFIGTKISFFHRLPSKRNDLYNTVDTNTIGKNKWHIFHHENHTHWYWRLGKFIEPCPFMKYFWFGIHLYCLILLLLLRSYWISRRVRGRSFVCLLIVR